MALNLPMRKIRYTLSFLPSSSIFFTGSPLFHHEAFCLGRILMRKAGRQEKDFGSGGSSVGYPNGFKLAKDCPPFSVTPDSLLATRPRKFYFLPIRKIHYTLYRDDSDFVVQCLDYDISTFGSTEQEALTNLKEAVELYLEND